jgi:hypothetical protein
MEPSSKVSEIAPFFPYCHFVILVVPATSADSEQEISKGNDKRTAIPVFMGVCEFVEDSVVINSQGNPITPCHMRE